MSTTWKVLISQNLAAHGRKYEILGKYNFRSLNFNLWSDCRSLYDSSNYIEFISSAYFT